MKTTLVICPNCNLHATFKFQDGAESMDFWATEAISTLVDLTKERRISYGDAGRMLIEISAWVQGISRETWDELVEAREMMNFLQSTFDGSVVLVDLG